MNAIEKASADALEATKAAAHSARMAMIAAIVSGALAIGGTIIGGIIAGQSARSTVAQQLSGETERSRAEFLRTQRQSLYAKVIAHEEELVGAENQFLAVMQSRSIPTTNEQFDKLFNNVKANIKLIRQDRYNIDILASESTRDAFASLYLNHEILTDHFRDLIIYKYTRGQSRPTFDFHAAQMTTEKRKEKFMTAARQDVTS